MKIGRLYEGLFTWYDWVFNLFIAANGLCGISYNSFVVMKKSQSQFRSHNCTVWTALNWNLGLCNVAFVHCEWILKLKAHNETSVQNLSITLSTVFKVKKKSQSQVLRDHSLGKSGSFIGKKICIRFYNIFGMKNVYLAVCWCARSFNHKRR